MHNNLTIGDYLKTPVSDIKILLCFVLKKSLTQLYQITDKTLKVQEKKYLIFLLFQLKKKPLAYVINQQGFYNLLFYVDENCLIPRPETELLVDIILNKFCAKKKITLLDIGTGSGAIAITIKKLRPNWQIVASDFSNKALMIAKKNSKNILQRKYAINFTKSYWFNSINNKKKFDIIVSNPPYIDSKSPYLKNLQNEPIKALVSNNKGLEDINHIINNANNYLKSKGYLLLEHGFDQKKIVMTMLNKKFRILTSFYDNNKIPRAILSYIKR